jgi:hypothetical protein
LEVPQEFTSGDLVRKSGSTRSCFAIGRWRSGWKKLEGLLHSNSVPSKPQCVMQELKSQRRRTAHDESRKDIQRGYPGKAKVKNCPSPGSLGDLLVNGQRFAIFFHGG